MCIFCEKAQAQLRDGYLTAAEKREAERCEKLREKRIRATILTGFLGAGKTTFLNFLLKSWGHGKRIGIVQNEFGSVDVDGQLMRVEKSQTEVITMPNGCLCCRVRGDTVEALKRLAERPGDKTFGEEKAFGEEEGGAPLDNLLIECSGLSEVIPVAQTFFADPFVQASFQLDGVICVCDAGNFESFEGGEDGAGAAGVDVARLLREQLSISDVCLLNKCDLVDSGRRDRIGARIRELNPSVKVVPCRHGKVNLGQVLKVNSFSLENVLSLDAHFLNVGGEYDHQGVKLRLGNALPGAPAHVHEQFGSIGLQMEDAVNVEALKEWLRGVVEKHGEKLVRIKGVVRSNSAPRTLAIVQGVGGHIEVGEETAPADGSTPMSRLVLIGRLLEHSLRMELRRGFLGLAARVDDAPKEEEEAPQI